MTFDSIKSRNLAIDLLREYAGGNPYLLKLKRDVILNGKVALLSEFNIEYIHKNVNTTPKVIKKTVKIADWYGEKLKDTYGIEFIPEKVHIIALLGETNTSFHCYIKYRQNMDPLEIFLPKKGVLENFLVSDYHTVNVDFNRYDKLSMSKDPNRKLKEHQKDAVKFLLSRKKCILADDMGLGKMEPITSLIPTTEGFKLMGDLKIGDLIYGEDGKAHPITKIFEHKDKEIYLVKFSDGTQVECGLDHLWKVRTKNMVKRKQGWKTMSLKEMIESGLQYSDEYRIKQGLKPRSKYEIPVSNAVEYKEKKYLIHPYILGACIGDGNLCSGSINISIPDNERETSERISLLLNEDMILKEDRSTSCPRYRIQHKIRQHENKFYTEIKRLGLNIVGIKKFIPDEYKFGSIEQRIDLLRGLMDTDGTIGKQNRITFSTNSELLAKDVAELVFSLGGVARVGKYIHKDKINPEYQVRIQVKFNPFYLKRKAEKYHPTFLKYCSKYIVSAEYVRNGDARCLMVDYSEHTYLTSKNYIVTHNTNELSVAAIEGNFDSVLIICPASLKTNWKRELMWYVPERDISIIDSFNGKTKGDLEKFLGYAEGKSGLSVDELKKEATEQGNWKENRFIIINYDILDKFYEIPKTRSKENIQIALENSPLLRYIQNRKSLIIIDEAHRLSNNTSIRYKVIKDLIKRGNPDSIYLATGTPITNSPQNLFCLLQLIENDISSDWQYYMDRYCGAMKIPAKGEKEKWTNRFLNFKKKPNWYALSEDEKAELKTYIRNNARMITIAKDATNLDELKTRISHIYLRRIKEDLNEGLPEKHIHEILYDFDLTQTMEYERLWEEYEKAQLEADPTKEINKELLEGAIYRRYCSNQMVPNTIKLAEEFIAKGEKVVIATCYDDELNILKEHFGDKCVVYNGKMSAKQKDAAQEAFTNDPNIMVFLGQIIAAGVGITLIASHIIIFNDLDYVPGNVRQFEDRIYRIGQTKDVHIYYQIFRNTQYEKIWNLVLKKELNINQVIKKESEK